MKIVEYEEKYIDDVKDLLVEEVGYIPCANMDRNVYIIKYKDVEIPFFMAGVRVHG